MEPPRSHHPRHLRQNLPKTAGMPTISRGCDILLTPATTISGLPLFQSIGVCSSKSMRSILWPQIELHIPSTIGCDNLDIFCTSFHNTILGPLISTN